MANKNLGTTVTNVETGEMVDIKPLDEGLFKCIRKLDDFKITGKWSDGLDLMGTLGSLKVGNKLRIAIPVSETHELCIMSTITSRRKVRVKWPTKA